MSVVAHDFETSGLPLFKERSVDIRQPHIVQMALVRYGDDGTELSSECVVVKPDGWTISAEMTAIHGISHEQAMAIGIPENDAIALFLVTMAQATVRVAHNEQFDRRIARIAMARAGYQRALIECLEAQPSCCTCISSKALVKAPATEKMLAAGFTGFKSPTLGECISHFWPDEAVEGLHGALADARYSGRLYWHLQSLAKAT